MNKTMTITVIALVAVVMGISAIVPALPQAIADHSVDSQGFTCPPNTPAGLVWDHVAFSPAGDSPDRNGNGFICENNIIDRAPIGTIDHTIDDIPNSRG